MKTQLDEVDRLRMENLTLKMNQAIAAAQAFKDDIWKRYELGPLDEIDGLTGVIQRKEPPVAAGNVHGPSSYKGPSSGRVN